ncbi:glycoside hydrolase superfamily [Gautieria morchelliformis]|nr:glycoside hydrolase superfamily [Gautieria morchelliformis]
MVAATTQMLLTTILQFILTSLTNAASAEQWRSRSIYQVVTDRFATSDLSGPPCDTSQRQYCNGTWTGLTKKLDYIQGMGFDAVWIAPIVHNIENETAYGQAYHGYWSQDITTLNAHYGDETSLNALSKALHDRGMYLLLDVVINHMAASALPTPFSAYTPFNQPAEFHPFCFITDYNNQTDVEQCSLGDTNVALVDLNTENQDVINGMYSWINQTVQKYSVDGVRIDTVKHIRKDFWPGFAQSAGVWTVGEVLDNRTSYVGDYTNFLDSVLDYPAYFALTSAFQNPSGNISALVEVVQQTQSYKVHAMSTASFLENHDQPRFQSLTTDQSLVKNAMAWAFITDGVPILYYGQEQGYSGSGDPNNREALWLSGYQTQNKPLLTHVTSLNQARKAAINASSTFLTTPMKILNSNANSLTISKPPLLGLLTNVGNASVSSWGVLNAGYSANANLMEVLTCTKMQADGQGGVSANTATGQPMIILPTSALAGSSLCNGGQATGTGKGNGAFSIRGALEGGTQWLLVQLAVFGSLLLGLA